MRYRVFLRIVVAGAIGFGIGLAAQAEGLTASFKAKAPQQITAPQQIEAPRH